MRRLDVCMTSTTFFNDSLASFYDTRKLDQETHEQEETHQQIPFSTHKSLQLVQYPHKKTSHSFTASTFYESDDILQEDFAKQCSGL